MKLVDLTPLPGGGVSPATEIETSPREELCRGKELNCISYLLKGNVANDDIFKKLIDILLIFVGPPERAT